MTEREDEASSGSTTSRGHPRRRRSRTSRWRRRRRSARSGGPTDLGLLGIGPTETEPAEALTPDRLLKGHRPPPESGWRRALYRASGGIVNLGDSAKVRARRDLERRAIARITGRTRFVPVIARKGGVGKTTTATLLGMTLASLRHDRVVAVDGNPDRGTLADRCERQTTATVWDVVGAAETLGSFAEMSRLVSRDKSRLDVIASETDPHRSRAFREGDYKRVAGLLGQYYSLVVTDCGTDFTHDVVPAILGMADAIVIVAGAAVDEARLASETVDMIEALGFPHLARSSVVAVQSASQTPVDVGEVERHFDTRVRGVVRIPRDPHLAEGAVIDLDRLHPSTRNAALELSALVLDQIADHPGHALTPRSKA